MTAMEQAIAALRSAACFADFVAERSGDEDAIVLHRQCTEAIGALKKEEIERAADREREDSEMHLYKRRNLRRLRSIEG